MFSSSKDEKYSHIDAGEMEKVRNAMREKHEWLKNSSYLCSQLPTYEDPAVTCDEIRAQNTVCYVCVFSSDLHSIGFVGEKDVFLVASATE